MQHTRTGLDIRAEPALEQVSNFAQAQPFFCSGRAVGLGLGAGLRSRTVNPPSRPSTFLVWKVALLPQ